VRAAVGNAADRKQVRGAAKKEREGEAQRISDLGAVMSTPEGRRFIWWLLGRAGIHESTMRGGPAMALYWAGKQDLSHMLLARLTKEHPDAYLLMQSEAITIEKQKQREDQAAQEIEESRANNDDDDDGS
jgi:hypothetical protein